MTETAPEAPETGETTDEVANEQPWYGSDLPEEDVGFIQNRGYGNISSVLNNVRDFEKMKGVPASQLLKLPTDMNEPGAMDDVYKALGRPETVEEYGDLKLPEELKDFKIDDDRRKWADGLSHKLGLNKQQRDALISETAAYESGMIKAVNEAMEQQTEIDLNNLYQKWGPDKEKKLEFARRAQKAGFDGDVTDVMDATMGSAKVLEAMAKFGEFLKEDQIPGGNDPAFGGKTVEQIKADIKQLSDELSAKTPEAQARLDSYNKGAGPDYEKMQRLNQLLTQMSNKAA